MDTYENGNEHEIILSPIQLGGSTSLPPKDPVKGSNSNASEEDKNKTGEDSQESSCKKPYTDPGMLAKDEYTNTSSIFNIFISHNSSDKLNKLCSVSHRLQLKQCIRELSHAVLKDVVVHGGWVSF